MNIATLTIEMAANVARLRQDMDNAAGIVQATTAKMQKAAELAGKALGLIGVGLSVSAFTGFIRNAIDAADALDEMSGRVGVGAKELSGLQLAYKQAGMGNEAMASSLAKLSREMSEGNAGLRALGVNTRNADGSLRGTTAVLKDVADKFTTLEDGAAKTALAVEIFGKSGTEMVPLLNSGSEGIAQMIAMAEKLGLVIEDSPAAQAGQFNDTLELLGLGVQGVGSRIAAQLLPTLTNLTGSFLETMTAGDRLKGVADFLAASLKILYTLGLGIVEVFSTVGKTLGAAVGQALAMLRGEFAAARGIGQEWQKDVTAGWSSTSAAVKAAWSEQGNAAVQSAATTMKINKDLLAAEKAREEAAKKTAAAAAKAAADQAKLAEDGAKLAASLLAQDGGLAGDFTEKWDKLNAAYAANKITLEQLILAQGELLAQQPAMKKALDEATKASQAAAEARRKESDGIEAYMRAQEEAAAASLKSVKDRISGLQDEEQAVELSRALNISLAEAVERVALARLEEKQAGFVDGSDGSERIRREIEERKKLLELVANKDIREREERGWSDMWSSVDRTAHDVFVNVFEGGSNVFKKLGQTLKASVLDVLYQMTVRKWIISIGTSLFGAGFGAAASAATGGAGGAGGVGNMLSGASLLGRVGGTFGMGLNAGFSGLVGEAGLMGALDAGGIALGAGNIMGGLGTIVGALGPIALGIGALVSLIGSTSGETRTGGQFGVAFDGEVVNNRRGQTYTYQGQQYDRDFSGGRRDALVNGQAYRLEGDPVAQESAIRDAVSGTTSSINDFLKALGSTATLTMFSAGLETSGKGRGGVFAGGALSNGATFGESGQGDNYAGTLYEKFSSNSPDFKQALADFALDLKQGTVQALQSVTDIPETVKKMLEGVDAEGLSEEAVNQLLESINAQIVGVNQLKSAFDAMGMSELAQMSFDAAAGLAEVAGGFDKLMSNLNTYYSNFYTQEEQRANVQRQLQEQFAALGLSMPDINAADAREQFKALVEMASKDMSESGRKTYAALLALSGAFASVTTSADDAAQAAEQAEQAQREAAQRAAEEAARAAAQAQREMLEAQRNALEQQRQLIEESLSQLQGLFDLVSRSARELFGQVQQAASMQAAQGRAFIAQALAAAKSTGYLPDVDKLSEAISAARNGIDNGAYASGAQQEFERMVVANQLVALEKIIGPQKSAAEKQLEVMKAQLKSLDEAVKAINGTTGAVYNLNTALGAYDQQKRIEAVRSAFTSFTHDPLRVATISRAAGWSMEDFATAFNQPLAQVQAYFSQFGINNFSDAATIARLEARYAEMKSTFATFTDDPWQVYNISKAKGWTTADIAGAYKMDLQAVRDFYLSQGIPAFATGAAFTNGIATRPTFFNMGQMGEIGPEGILPLANVGGRLGVYAAGGSNDRLVDAFISEVRLLRAKLDEVIDRQDEGNDNTGRFAEQFDNWTMSGRGAGMVKVQENV